MDHYEIIIFWSAEDDAFVAEVPELPGCMAHGATQEEALANAKDAAKLWIDTAKEFGDPVPEPKPAPEPKPEPAPVVEKPKKRHVMTLINGTAKEKAVFIEGEGEDEDGPSSTPAKPVAKPEPKKETKKEETKPTTPAAPTTTKTSRTRRS